MRMAVTTMDELLCGIIPPQSGVYFSGALVPAEPSLLLCHFGAACVVI